MRKALICQSCGEEMKEEPTTRCGYCELSLCAFCFEETKCEYAGTHKEFVPTPFLAAKEKSNE